MLGSFPPPRVRWSMNFYYPNIQNDMWRILGLIFYNDKEYFLETKKAFSEEKAKAFCREKGIGIGDTAVEIIRLKNNASDNFLQVVTPLNPAEVLAKIPECEAIVVTGQKAMDTLIAMLPSVEEPKVGSYSRFTCRAVFSASTVCLLPHVLIPSLWKKRRQCINGCSRI